MYPSTTWQHAASVRLSWTDLQRLRHGVVSIGMCVFTAHANTHVQYKYDVTRLQWNAEEVALASRDPRLALAIQRQVKTTSHCSLLVLFAVTRSNGTVCHV
eukprot:scpid21011/ scgid21239/ 